MCVYMFKNTYAAVVSVSVAAISSQSQTTALVHVPCMSKTVNIPEWWFRAAVL